MSKAIETIADLQPDPRNANQGSVRGHSIIERSVRQRGAGRSGLAAADGTMIAGSQTLQKMAELGIPIRPIHTTGDEWVVVIRDDIEPGSEEATLLALEDNRATEVGLVWEPGILAGIAEMGVDLGSLFTADEWAEVSMPVLPDAGAGGDEFDESGRCLLAGRQHPSGLRSYEARRVRVAEFGERDFREVRESLQTKPAPGMLRRTIGEQQRPRDDHEKVLRQGVEPMTVFQYDHERAPLGPRAQAFDEQHFKRPLAQLRIHRRGEFILRDSEVEKAG